MKIILIACFFSITASYGRNNQSPPRTSYEPVDISSITPKGWLLRQLKVMRDGSTGHLDEIYAKLKNDNGWLGGTGDGWEETPYWLDGATPLAYLLKDTKLQAKVLRYINWTLAHQRPSGYFGPLTKNEKEKGVMTSIGDCGAGEDWWPRMIMLKVMQQYYSATKDDRVIPFLHRYFLYQLASIKDCPVGRWSEWSRARGVENSMIAMWLYGIVKDPKLVELAKIIRAQSLPWSELFAGRDWVMDAAARQNDQHIMSRHSVNVAMGLKDPAINFLSTGDDKYLNVQKTAFADLMKLHGLPQGVFSGDEDLHGNEPTQGTEICTVVETMFSLENIIGITGDPYYMDALERIAFNALPAPITDDYNNKQYFQVPNQVQAARGAQQFSVTEPNGMSNVFGTLSGYTCCYTNMHQGWPKYAAHLWYHSSDSAIAAFNYAPSELSTVVNGKKVHIEEITDYPFSDEIVFKITAPQPLEFAFRLRVPGWCKQSFLSINGEPVRSDSSGIITLTRTWKTGDQIMLRLPMSVTTSNWAKNSRVVERGPLVYALKVPEVWKKDIHPQAGEYFSVFPTAAWNYALTRDMITDPAKMTVTVKPVQKDFLWNQAHAPIMISATARKLPDWKLTDGIAYQPVCERGGLYQGKANDSIENITLIPYGCTKVRIVAFPVVRTAH